MGLDSTMIKKLIIVGFVALTFIIYSVHQRDDGSQMVNRIINSKNNITNTATPSQSTTQASMPSSSATYKDGSYTGRSADATYGFIQVRAKISGGKLTNVEFLDYPQDRDNSVVINDYAMPLLKDQAIKVQSAQVDGVSGATDTSQAFVESLSDALSQAHV